MRAVQLRCLCDSRGSSADVCVIRADHLQAIHENVVNHLLQIFFMRTFVADLKKKKSPLTKDESELFVCFVHVRRRFGFDGESRRTIFNFANNFPLTSFHLCKQICCVTFCSFPSENQF